MPLNHLGVLSFFAVDVGLKEGPCKQKMNRNGMLLKGVSSSKANMFLRKIGGSRMSFLNFKIMGPEVFACRNVPKSAREFGKPNQPNLYFSESEQIEDFFEGDDKQPFFF